jgi:hypothetical protein
MPSGEAEDFWEQIERKKRRDRPKKQNKKL